MRGFSIFCPFFLFFVYDYYEIGVLFGGNELMTIFYSLLTTRGRGR